MLQLEDFFQVGQLKRQGTQVILGLLVLVSNFLIEEKIRRIF